jgi:hypothetical protein
MEPGRELDALVAEKVMGLKLIEKKEPFENYITYKHITLGTCTSTTPPGKYLEINRERGYGNQPYTTYIPVPNYSTDISAAFEVLEKVPCHAYEIYQEWAQSPRCILFEWNSIKQEMTKIESSGKSAPHAICLAALKAMNVHL